MTTAILHGEVFPRGGTAHADEHRIAALLCLFGFFLKIMLSDPLLLTLGIDYSGGLSGKFYEKIHPGNYFVLLSFVWLLCDGGDPIDQALRIFRRYTLFSLLLLLDMLLFLYWAVKNPSGVGMILDTHMMVPIGAIVFSHAPRSWCRRAVYFLIALAAANSGLGVLESLGRFRLFPFSEDWVVLREDHFRASAFLGHPLNNAMFTSVMLFVAMAMRFPPMLKAVLLALFLASLVAFGGRGGLIFSVIGLLPLGFAAIKDAFSGGRMTRLRMIFLSAAVLVMPLLLAAGLYGLIHTDIGERVAVMSSFQDESAQGRWLAFKAPEFMTQEEIIFGASADRVVEIGYRMGLAFPLSDIENPWVLMFMFLGVIAFPFWLFMTLAFVWRLMKGSPAALQLAVILYFVVASTSNSFGRKDAIYAIMVAAVVCARRGLMDGEEMAESYRVASPPS